MSSLGVAMDLQVHFEGIQLSKHEWFATIDDLFFQFPESFHPDLLFPNEWQFAFDQVISDTDGRAQFTKFLQSEYSEENILFWWAVEELKVVSASESRSEFERTVLEMFETFIASESPLAINIDHDTRTDIIDRPVYEEVNAANITSQYQQSAKISIINDHNRRDM
ncbi:regulator of G protein signaling domain protein [Teladorsagia circumcincta]|uniref:Regulator of G protein signaling domain protein n=1 Tax=Teladorsagia circumcincta TaxID=45464 RepID=A0A2G9U6M9_TELCI|nr:regulator of G protein signaling domain protein [Teladorsagia circumcincta]